tara:strand:- start:652 stop:1179 length:528 start_codon:yes stop_codon:yes gene_type:complete
MYKIKLTFFVSLIALTIFNLAGAKGVYLEPETFLSDIFDQSIPEPSRILIKGQLKKDIKKILGHRYKTFRIPYWQKDGRTVWILEEIGKELPITAGFVITNGKIEQFKVLIFRESRGWEIRNDFFTDQFYRAHLTADKKLNQHIDNITGATLSVNAMKKLSRMALYLHQQVTTEE